ncbi:MAG: 50S ribosomal protein L7/L12 [Candidatus Calescibacterium sp.]|nr:50S ribosomal protein L7/L12 [Candidatus Calescibacterium sp.]MCX7734630.1 50S ribosomal protein L7/L12 [bacterium]MDW8087020.1 50S ribosomal protein L7/L12 [Candidatus Calescibacterium sp.]
MTEKVKGIVDAISSLNVMELVQLVKALEKTFGISGVPIAAAPVGQPSAGAAAPAEKQEEQKQKTFNVVLKDAGPNKLQIIKEIRAILPNLNIKEAKDFVEALPKVVKEGVSEAEAKELKERLEKVGAKVELT